MRHAALFALLLLSACGGSSSDAPARDTTSGTAVPAAAAAGAPSEDDVKQLVTRRVQSTATGVGSQPSKIDVSFHSIEIAPARALNEQDKIDGIRGDASYAVRVSYSELRAWGNGQTETRDTQYLYDFYRDAFGKWDAVGRGPVQ